jgi:hypothetical protein
VRTSEDFGLQGEWPSHPELLDWLAVEFRESGWDVKRLIASVVDLGHVPPELAQRPELASAIPRPLARRYPRRRLDGRADPRPGAVRLGPAGERSAGRRSSRTSPRPVAGVAMLQSNTRDYERGKGEDLWRRSLYTYWKRAVPRRRCSDASTRRRACAAPSAAARPPRARCKRWSCGTSSSSSRPARALAQRTLQEAGSTSTHESMFMRCGGRKPEADEAEALSAALADFRKRYVGCPDDARACWR